MRTISHAVTIDEFKEQREEVRLQEAVAGQTLKLRLLERSTIGVANSVG